MTAGKSIDVDGDEVVRHEIADVIEPEGRELREDLALVGNAGSENVVERRNAIGGDDEQVFAEIVDVTYLAAARERQATEVGFENDSFRIRIRAPHRLT